MFRKFIILAITSGLAAKLYRKHLGKQKNAVTPVQPSAKRRG
jgi:hypothetical protein